MAHTTLPAAHTEADCLLAERIGRSLELAEVHVFWTLPAPAGAPAHSAERSERANPSAGLSGAIAAVGGLFERLGARIMRPRGQ